MAIGPKRNIGKGWAEADIISFNTKSENLFEGHVTSDDTDKKVRYVFFSVLTLGLLPICSFIGEKSLLAYHGIFPGGMFSRRDVLNDDEKAIRIGSYGPYEAPRIESLNAMGGMLVPSHLGDAKKKLEEDGKTKVLSTVVPMNGDEPIEATKKKIEATKKNIRDAFQDKTCEKVVIFAVLEGGWFTRGIYSRSHIVTLVIDKKNRKIVFLDPKGKTLADHKSCGLSESTRKVSDLYRDVIDVIGKPEVYGALTLKDIEKVAKQCPAAIQRVAPPADLKIQSPLLNPDPKLYGEIVSKKAQEREPFILPYMLPAKENMQPWRLVQKEEQYQWDAHSCGVHAINFAMKYDSSKDDGLPADLETRNDLRGAREAILNEIYPEKEGALSRQDLHVPVVSGTTADGFAIVD